MLGLGFEGIGGLIHTVFFILVVVDILTAQKKMKSVNKAIWVIISLVIPIIGSVVYYFFGRK
ncbi:PLDc_N domain-containing protein [archaeon]|jgi:hypothetical protein|nr:PLDc_N domain-containing protein [archaeon]